MALLLFAARHPDMVDKILLVGSPLWKNGTLLRSTKRGLPGSRLINDANAGALGSLAAAHPQECLLARLAELAAVQILSIPFPAKGTRSMFGRTSSGPSGMKRLK